MVTLDWTREEMRGIASLLSQQAATCQEYIDRAEGVRGRIKRAMVEVVREEKTLAEKAASDLLQIVATLDNERG